jgi:hypothetical protein
MNQQNILQSPIIPPKSALFIQRVSQIPVPVLIVGEQGVGKEWVAKAIHQSGPSRHDRFHKIDCKMLRERSLFSDLLYFFQEIRHWTIPATLFLREVGCLNQKDQLKLLGLIEEGIFEYKGEERMVTNLRWIASSSQELRHMTEEGRFSKNLYDCFNTLSIALSPLRDRIKDIPAIVQYLLVERATRVNPKLKIVSQNVLSLLQSYWWPGNLKELELVLLRSAIFSTGEELTEKDLLFNAENGNNLFSKFLRGIDFKCPSKKRDLSSTEVFSLSSLSFLQELVRRIKNPLASINTLTRLLPKKFNDAEYRESFYRVVTNDIERIDSVLNDLLTYITMRTPLDKSNTIHQTLEEVLKRHETTFTEKGVKIVRRLEKELPETTIHEEQLRYILHSLIQYILPILPPHGSIGFLTKRVEESKQSSEEGVRYSQERKWIEILIIFTGFKKSTDTFEMMFGHPPTQSPETEDMELRLIREIVNNNGGKMVIEINEKKPRTLISLRLPIERRRVIYYPRGNI